MEINYYYYYYYYYYYLMQIAYKMQFKGKHTPFTVSIIYICTSIKDDEQSGCVSLNKCFIYYKKNLTAVQVVLVLDLSALQKQY